MLDLKSNTDFNDYLIFLLTTITVIFIYQHFFAEIPVPVFDALRYIEYGINLKDTGIFGLNVSNGIVQPGNENTPLFPFYIYIASSLDENLYQSLLCLLNNKNNTSCELNLDFFVWMQCAFTIVTLSCVWLLANMLTNSNFIAWSSAILAILSGELFYYANQFLTEALLISLFSAFILTLYLSFRTKKIHWHIITALLLGLLTLTRPEYDYLFRIIFISYFLLCLLRNNKLLWRSLILVFVSYYAIIGPWQMRNYVHFDDPSLTGQYGSTILAYRVAYNQMTWTEWGVSFVYWFPDCGDSISKKLFPKDYYEKLSLGDGYYFSTASKQIIKKINAETYTPEQALSYLLKNEIIGNLFKHSMVTIPLTWRGIFIAKYWGVLGLFCFMILVFHFRDPVNQKLLYLSLPAWFLVLLHAFVSVNIPRYNLILIPFYSISMGIVLYSFLSFFSSKMKHTKQSND